MCRRLHHIIHALIPNLGRVFVFLTDRCYFLDDRNTLMSLILVVRAGNVTPLELVLLPRSETTDRLSCNLVEFKRRLLPDSSDHPTGKKVDTQLGLITYGRCRHAPLRGERVVS